MSDEFTWPQILGDLVKGRDLNESATKWAMGEILSDAATSAQIAGFAVALRAKGETLGEIQGLVAAMLEKANLLDVNERVVDIVGTGGDQAKTVNISTMASVVIAGAGIPVVKHGNRAASSASGSADVLEALGVRLDVPVDQVLEVFNRARITFCFAPMFHSSLRFAAKTRSELGIPTTFNFLGPLTNPARPAAMALGVADLQIAPKIAAVLADRGTDALVFRGEDGLDELTVTTTSSVWVATDGKVETLTIDPRALGIELATSADLRGEDANYNAQVFKDILHKKPGPIRDAVLLNAAAGIAAFRGLNRDIEKALAAGIAEASESIDSGAAAGVLENWIKASNELAPIN